MQILRMLKPVAFVALAALAFTACKDRGYTKVTYVANVPIYQSYDEFRASSVRAEAPKALTNPGKIYYKDNMLFVNDQFKGIHIFDNSNPAAPQNIGYLNIPGNVDLVIKNDIMYADARTDLLTIDISDLNNPVILHRNSNVFPNALPEWDMNYPIAPIDDSKGIIVGWEVKEITEVQDIHPNINWGNGNLLVMFEDQMQANEIATITTVSNMSPGTGISGSMARFVLNGDFLYTVNDNQLGAFDLTSPTAPTYGSSQTLNRTVETVSPMDDYLFIGTNSGMLIYSVIDDPINPEYVSTFVHATMCDPVLVDGDYAYITLRGGNFCGGWGDRVDVVDISNIQHPNLVSTRSLTNPYGLGKAGDALFVCDGVSGLRVFNVSDPYTIQSIDHLSGFNTYDVIPFDNTLMVIGEDGLYQYDYSNPSSLQQLSVIPVE